MEAAACHAAPRTLAQGVLPFLSPRLRCSIAAGTPPAWGWGWFPAEPSTVLLCTPADPPPAPDRGVCVAGSGRCETEDRVAPTHPEVWQRHQEPSTHPKAPPRPCPGHLMGPAPPPGPPAPGAWPGLAWSPALPPTRPPGGAWAPPPRLVGRAGRHRRGQLPRDPLGWGETLLAADPMLQPPSLNQGPTPAQTEERQPPGTDTPLLRPPRLCPPASSFHTPPTQHQVPSRTTEREPTACAAGTGPGLLHSFPPEAVTALSHSQQTTRGAVTAQAGTRAQACRHQSPVPPRTVLRPSKRTDRISASSITMRGRDTVTVGGRAAECPADTRALLWPVPLPGHQRAPGSGASCQCGRYQEALGITGTGRRAHNRTHCIPRGPRSPHTLPGSWRRQHTGGLGAAFWNRWLSAQPGVWLQTPGRPPQQLCGLSQPKLNALECPHGHGVTAEPFPQGHRENEIS